MSLHCKHPLLDAVYHPDCPGCAEAVALVKAGKHPVPEHPRSAKQVIVMRKDLNMRKGKMVAQGAHASLGAAMVIRKELDGHPGHSWGEAFRQWFEGTFTKVCVSVDSEQELNKILDDATWANLPVKLIIDNGLTEFNGVPTATCLAIGPAWSDGIDKITGHLKLL